MVVLVVSGTPTLGFAGAPTVSGLIEGRLQW